MLAFQKSHILFVHLTFHGRCIPSEFESLLLNESYSYKALQSIQQTTEELKPNEQI